MRPGNIITLLKPEERYKGTTIFFIIKKIFYYNKIGNSSKQNTKSSFIHYFRTFISFFSHERGSNPGEQETKFSSRQIFFGKSAKIILVFRKMVEVD